MAHIVHSARRSPTSALWAGPPSMTASFAPPWRHPAPRAQRVPTATTSSACTASPVTLATSVSRRQPVPAQRTRPCSAVTRAPWGTIARQGSPARSHAPSAHTGTPCASRTWTRAASCASPTHSHTLRAPPSACHVDPVPGQAGARTHATATGRTARSRRPISLVSASPGTTTSTRIAASLTRTAQGTASSRSLSGVAPPRSGWTTARAWTTSSSATARPQRPLSANRHAPTSMVGP
mmetsp:Transcript_138152/g.240177  ORF Transcript_138152/g.240177 Transcript_138152/m.240177 type:complete len:237 (-) Transcript_138152:2149-2859(-)